MRRAVTLLTLCALSACGIGVVGEKPPAPSDAGPPVSDAGPNVSDVVFPNDAPDAALDACLAACPSYGHCDFATGTCVIPCAANGVCRNAIVRCPDNVPCRVECAFHGCKTVSCGKASKCDVRCEGGNDPEDDGCDVDCTGGTKDADPVVIESCNVTCVGNDACHHLDLRAQSSTIDCTSDHDACDKIV